LISAPPNEITGQLSSNGFSMLSRSIFGTRKTIYIDLSKYRRTSNVEYERGYLVTRSLRNRVNRQFGGNSVVESIRPDTLQLAFSKTAKKQLSVDFRRDFTFKKQFRIDGAPEIRPASVLVEGPIRLIDTLTKIPTEMVIRHDIDKDFTVAVNFESFYMTGMFRLSHPKVMVTVPVDEFTEGSVVVPIRIANIPDGYSAKILQDSVEVKYQVGMKNYNKVSGSLFKATVELPDTADFATQSKLKIKLTEQPEFVKSLRLNPERVDYFVRKK